MTPSITQDQINQALGSLLESMLPQLAPSNIIIGQVNRVAEPEGDFVVMWPLRRPRLGTNVDTPADVEFTGSIAGTSMTVTAVNFGTIDIGASLFGVGVAAGTTVESQQSGTPGGAGAYTVSVSQTLASQTLAAGVVEVMQPTEAVMQVDVHGPASADNAQTLSTLFRDDFAVDEMEASGISPLYADEPRQLPFVNAARQYENRWSVDLHFQIDPSLFVPQDFADAVTVDLYNVD